MFQPVPDHLVHDLIATIQNTHLKSVQKCWSSRSNTALLVVDLPNRLVGSPSGFGRGTESASQLKQKIQPLSRLSL